MEGWGAIFPLLLAGVRITLLFVLLKIASLDIGMFFGI